MTLKKQGCIAALGTFDGVHRGHAFLLGHLKRMAAQRGEKSAVITFRNHPLSVIRPERVPPALTSHRRKCRLLESMGVDTVISLDFDERLRSLTAAQFMSMIKQRYGITTLLLGYDTRFGHDRPERFEDYKALGEQTGIEVISAPELDSEGEPVSSSRIRRAVSKGDINTANELLGHRLSLRGTVGKGKQLGRTIGFPTANIEPECPGLLIPSPGVYAVRATLPDGSSSDGMLNIGYRPTVDGSADPKLTIELHVLGYEGNLYGCVLTIEFIARLRDERKFASIDELQKQLAIDRLAAAAALSGQDARR
ncbi:MAG: bifunctional riboflavin kinase/FAD synthetase [Muribaculaceae bacterium]|nr:bifunctional riboflavin kinase/FAD synthetase [Muribaculaceae bacterium]